MAVPAVSSDAGSGYIRTVLGQQKLDELDSSSLAMPARLSGGRGQEQKSLRIQRQVQQTLARKSKGSSVHGSLHRTNSVPEYVYKLDAVETDFASRPSFGTSYYLQSHQIGSQGSYENGWGPRILSYNAHRTMEEKFQRQPLKRLEISPDGSHDKLAFFQNDILYNRGPTIRHGESKRSSVMAPRYARSEILGYTSNHTPPRGYSMQRHFYIGSANETAVDSAPNSPGMPIYQRIGNSRSMNNLMEKESYLTSGSATGQVRNSVGFQAGPQNKQFLKSSWHQSTFRSQNAKEASQPTSLTSTTAEAGGKRMTMTAAMAAAAGNGFVEQQKIAPTGSQLGNQEQEMTLERAVNILQTENTVSPRVLAAIVFIQHESFQRAEARRKVYLLGGIPRLLELLNVQNEDVQRAACGALRNLVYEDNDNKLEVSEQKGISSLLRLLQQTRDVETKKQITGLLWNLSSNDQLKNVLIREALKPLTETVLIPYSGWPDRDYPKSSIIPDPDIFYNATGCLSCFMSTMKEISRRLSQLESNSCCGFFSQSSYSSPLKMPATETSETSGRTTFRTRPKSPKNPQQP